MSTAFIMSFCIYQAMTIDFLNDPRTLMKHSEMLNTNSKSQCRADISIAVTYVLWYTLSYIRLEETRGKGRPSEHANELQPILSSYKVMTISANYNCSCRLYDQS